MKEQFKLNAINLKSYSISEADKIILMYSREKGLIKGIAKGIKKTSGRLGSGRLGSGRMELLSANKMMLNKGRTLNTICQAEAVNTFFNLRNDMNKLFYAMYCAEIVTNFGRENDPDSEEIYGLFYNFLDAVSKAEKKPEIMLAVLKFQLKIMHITGYSPMLNGCVKCRSKIDEHEIYFSSEQGGILCRSCAEQAVKKIKIHSKIKDFLYTLLSEDFNTPTRYDSLADEKVCGVCINLLKNYIEYYSPKRFKTSEILEMCR